MKGEAERLARVAARTMRRRFEAWAAGKFKLDRLDDADEDSKYANFSTQAAFEGWIGATLDEAMRGDQ
jgi:hypothetical protein